MIARGIVVGSALVSVVLLSLIYAVVAGPSSGAEAGASASPGAAESAPAQPAASFPPAQAVTIEEVSRHPSDMPDSPDYTYYEDGQFGEPATRNGPLTIEVHFTVIEGVAEVMPGTTMQYFTFNGAVPGPMIRGMVGDTVDFFLTNDAGNLLPHNVDFHAVTGPGGGAVRLDTAPGATSELKVKLLNPGIYIYHCAFPDIPMHISHGMYGLIVVEPEGGLPAVDHEYYVMQSEWYSDAGADKNADALADLGHLTFSNAYGNLEQPTFVTFNGRPGAVTGDRAIGVFADAITAGETVRLFVGDIGPNLVSSFHVIGEIFDTVYVEGSFDLVNHSVQSTLIPAGGAVGVEFVIEVPGDYLMVDHSIFRTHKGAAGVIHAGGSERPDIYESIEYSDEIRGG